MLQDIVTWKGELYFVDEPTADPAKLEGSLVAFTKNGQMQGIAYRSAQHILQKPASVNPFCRGHCKRPDLCASATLLAWVCRHQGNKLHLLSLSCCQVLNSNKHPPVMLAPDRQGDL